MTLALRGYCLLLAFSAFAYSFWFNLIGVTGAVALSAATTLVTITLWVALRRQASADEPRASGRRVPWRAVPVALFVLTALLSLIWSDWPTATVLTFVVQATFILQAIFLTRVCTGSRLLDTVEAATALILVLSVVLESVVALIGTPLLPLFLTASADDDPHVYWVRGNLFDGFLTGGRIQGIVGNANLLAAICVVVLVIQVLRLAASRRHVGARLITIALALWLGIRAGSAAMFIAAAVIVVLALVVLVRRRLTSTPARRWFAAGILAASAVVGVVAVANRDLLFRLVGRSESLTGRTEIWAEVWQRAITSPIVGHGYSSPWLPWDPAFENWITDHGVTVFYAHNMWLDIFLQLGAVGVLLVLALYGTATARSWALAVRPGASVEALIPLLLMALLLVQGLTESVPIMYWGLGMTCAIAVWTPTSRSRTDLAHAARS